MSNYVKYTAADGTVHLCHEDSPMLMHAKKNKVIGTGGQTTKMAWNTFQTAYSNLINFCNDNKIVYSGNKNGPPYNLNFATYYKDNNGRVHGIDLGKITIHDNPAKEYTLFINDPGWRDRTDKDVLAMNDIMRGMKDQLKKYKLMSDGYYVSK